MPSVAVYGLDTASNTVWAVINHTSDFAVVGILDCHSYRPWPLPDPQPASSQRNSDLNQLLARKSSSAKNLLASVRPKRIRCVRLITQRRQTRDARNNRRRSVPAGWRFGVPGA